MYFEVITPIYIPGLGQTVYCQDSASMQSGQPKRMLTSVKAGAWPAPPSPPWNWSGGATYGMDGNNHYGNCEQCSGIHWDQAATLSATGTQSQFAETAIESQYLAVSGGDNGWNEINLTYTWHTQGLGGNSQATIYDYLNIDWTDQQTMLAALAFFGPLIWNGTLSNAWYQQFKTGYTFGTPYTANPALGHSVLLLGIGADGTTWEDITWGTYGYFTQQAIIDSAFGLVTVFSPRWFNSLGYAPNGLHYDFLKPLWLSLGGIASQFPAVSPFPPPGPPPPPPPPPPPAFAADVALFVGAKQIHIGESGWTMRDDIPPSAGQTVKINYGARVVHAPKHWTQTPNATGYDVGISLSLNQVHAPGWMFAANGSAGVIAVRVGQRTGTMPSGWSQI